MGAILSSCEVFLQNGFMYAILAMGFYISFSILDFPDLTVEGTVLTGGVVCALLLNSGFNPWLAMLIAFICGAAAGCITGLLNVKLKIRPLLCGILVSTGLITVNLILTVVGMGGSFNGEGALTNITIGRTTPTIVRCAPATWIPNKIGDFNLRRVVIYLIVALVVKLILDLYLKTKNGLLLRATGDNAQYTTMLARDPGTSKIIGLAIGNGLASLCGALMAQSNGNANQSMGLGMIVIGLASVIIGLSVFGKIRIMKPTTMAILGSVIYQACFAVAALAGLPTAYNKLLMAVLFTLALVLSGVTGKKKGGEL